jgi:hypothetical protein
LPPPWADFLKKFQNRDFFLDEKGTALKNKYFSNFILGFIRHKDFRKYQRNYSNVKPLILHFPQSSNISLIGCSPAVPISV